METIRTVDLQELKARVARAEYTVDSEAVAEAIVRRALSPPDRAPPVPVVPNPGAMLAVDGGISPAAA